MKAIPLFFALQLAVLFSVAGCSKRASAATDTTGLSWLALGDSYTIGESVRAEDRYHAQTAALLRAHQLIAATPQYIARTGWTTTDLQDAMGRASIADRYDIVSLLIGVNDQFQGMDTAGYRVHFTQLLQHAIQLAGDRSAHVFVVSIPDYGVTPFGGGAARIGKEIDQFNRINREISMAYKVNYTDITAISREAATDQSLTAPDGLHPSAKQYARWSLLLDPAIRDALK